MFPKTVLYACAGFLCTLCSECLPIHNDTTQCQGLECQANTRQLQDETSFLQTGAQLRLASADEKVKAAEAEVKDEEQLLEDWDEAEAAEAEVKEAPPSCEVCSIEVESCSTLGKKNGVQVVNTKWNAKDVSNSKYSTLVNGKKPCPCEAYWYKSDSGNAKKCTVPTVYWSPTINQCGHAYTPLLNRCPSTSKGYKVIKARGAAEKAASAQRACDKACEEANKANAEAENAKKNAEKANALAKTMQAKAENH